MTDIVERLRNSYADWARGINGTPLLYEAADEIEQLRAKLSELEQRPTDAEIIEAVRTALNIHKRGESDG